MKALAQKPNYQVLLGCRDVHKGESAASSLGAPPNVNPIPLDINDDESIEHAALAIGQHFGKLDILINNAGKYHAQEANDDFSHLPRVYDLLNLTSYAGIGARELPPNATFRQKGEAIYTTNAISTAAITERLLPLLSKSSLPKIIFVSSGAGSLSKLTTREPLPEGFWYGSSKSALNHIAIHYARKFPEWKVNAVCPGLRATKINGVELTEETDPKLGAVRVVELCGQGVEGETGGYSNSEGAIPW